MGMKRWEIPSAVQQNAMRLLEVERALWVHRLSGRTEAACALATLAQAVDRGWPVRARPRRRLAMLIAAMERRWRTSSFGSERWQSAARALARLVVAQDRVRAVRLGEAADVTIDSLGASTDSAARALVAGARERRRCLRQDLLAAMMPMAVHTAIICASASGARIEELVNVAVAAVARAVDEVDGELSGEYELAVARAVDRAVGRFLESVPHEAESLTQSMSGGF